MMDMTLPAPFKPDLSQDNFDNKLINTDEFLKDSEFDILLPNENSPEKNTDKAVDVFADYSYINEENKNKH